MLAPGGVDMRWRRTRHRKLYLLVFCAVLVTITAVLTASMRPLIRELARAKVENRAQYIINEAIEELLDSGEID